MKVWLVNGSPHKEGNTNAVLFGEPLALIP